MHFVGDQVVVANETLASTAERSTSVNTTMTSLTATLNDDVLAMLQSVNETLSNMETVLNESDDVMSAVNVTLHEAHSRSAGDADFRLE